MMICKKIKLYIQALLKAKKYDNIVILGYNCEVAYRFFKQYKFVDSSLFAWSYVTFEQLKFFLENPDKVANGDFFLEHGMFTCKNSGISFHGRTDLTAITDVSKIDNDVLENEKAELRSRIAYLKEKFYRYCSNGKNTLFIRKISSKEAENINLTDNINWLYQKLSSICSNDFKLILVCEKRFSEKLQLQNTKIIVKTVEKYSPDENVTDKKAGDKFGWRLIFTEFQPAKVKKQSKKLKFEEIN